MRGSLRTAGSTAARLAVGPIVLLAFFFADWVRGTGILAGHSFTGFDLVAFSGRLQALDLGPWEAAALLGGRFAVLGVAVAAAWQCVLSLGLPGRRAYLFSGWYIIASAVCVISAGVVLHGTPVPEGGFLLAAAGVIFLAAHYSAGRRAGRAALP